MTDDNPYESPDAPSDSPAELPVAEADDEQGAPGWLAAVAVVVIFAIIAFLFWAASAAKLTSGAFVIYGLFLVTAIGLGLVAASHSYRSRAIYLAGACCSLGGITGVLCLIASWILGFEPFGLE